MRLKYTFGALFTLPFLPLMYVQGKRIKAAVPVLPEAEGPEGKVAGGEGRLIRLLAIGESTVAGVGVSTHANGFTGSLAAELAEQFRASVHWRVYARSGYTTRQITEVLLPKIMEKEVDLIVVGTGGNDAFQLRRPRRWKQDVQRLIRAISYRFPGTPICFLNMPPIRLFPAFTPLIKRTIGGLVDIFGAQLESVVMDHTNVHYNNEAIDLAIWQERHQLSGPASDFFSDGVHPAPITYQVWGKEMAWFIKSKSSI